MDKNIKNKYKFLKNNFNKTFVNYKIKNFFSGLYEFSKFGNNEIRDNNIYNFLFKYRLKLAVAFAASILIFILSFPYFNKIYLEKKYKNALYNELVQSYDETNDILDIDINFTEIDFIDNYLLFNNNNLF